MKKTLRKGLIQKRRALGDDIWAEKSSQIMSYIQNSDFVQDSDTVMIFMDFRKEVKTAPIIEWLWSCGKTVVIPRVKKGEPLLELCIIKEFGDMNLSSLGILEPKEDHTLFATPESIDFIFMPGVAFTKHGGRLGYGGGYYDRLIPMTNSGVPLVALAFDLQIVDALPLEDHDQIMDKIITESGIINCKE